MNSITKILLLVCTTILSWSADGFGQQSNHCGTDLIMNTPRGEAYYRETSSKVFDHLENATNGGRSTLVVPLVFHIVHNAAVENIDDSLVYQQIIRLNEDFQRLNADSSNTPAPFKSLAGSMDIEFCLAQIDPAGNPTSGIVRTATFESSFPSGTPYHLPDPVKHGSSGGVDAWDTEKYLNVWICNLTGSTAYTAPVGNFVDPTDDGIVCHYNHIGNSGVSPYDMGRTMVHEMGHWFGLKHIWGDDNGACSGTDYMADTPNQSNWNGSCPTFPVTDNCTPTYPGVMFMNYMDYTNDGCRNMFSNNQTSYMQAFYDALLTDYFLENKCTPLTSTVNIKEEKLFIAQQYGHVVVQSEKEMSSIAFYDTSGRLLMVKNNCGKRIDISSSDFSGMVIIKVNFQGSFTCAVQRIFLTN